MTNYQHRMRKFVWLSNAYGVGAFIGVAAVEPRSLVAWLVVASTATLLYALAYGFDAVFDSLSER